MDIKQLALYKKLFGGGSGEATHTIKAGKYQLLNHYIGDGTDKNIAQALVGTLQQVQNENSSSPGTVSEYPFECIWRPSGDTACFVEFITYSDWSFNHTEINPSYYYTEDWYITTTEDQAVSAAFYEWFNTYTKKVPT